MKIRIAIGIFGIVLLAAFAGFSRLAKQGRFDPIDFDVTVKVQDRMPKRFNEVWEDISFFVTPIPSIVFVGVLTLYAFLPFREKRIRWGALLIPLAFAALVGGEIYGKSVVHHPAPPFFMIKNPTTIFPKYHVIEQYSYPSGHAARAVFLAMTVGFLLLRSNRKLLYRWLIFGTLAILVLIVCVGKIYLGHHWVSDIIGGLILGAGFACLGALLVYDRPIAKND